jgi:hypothetical protein
MDQAGARALTSQLAEDLAWLEEHCRSQPGQENQTGKLRFGGALIRNVIGPYLDGQSPRPLHLAVVGGAGAGKSTIANFLSGATLAEANPQAGFTRHPVAYTCENGQSAWPAHLGFLGSLQRLLSPSPASLDADVYQVRRIPTEPGAMNLLEDFIIWDCPDMTTWAATGYVPRLLEVAALADVIVYVASDERYNDEVPTQFLRLLLQAGKPVIICLVKMREEDAPAFVAHFQKEVLQQAPAPPVACLTVPHLLPQQLANPKKEAGKYRIPLLNQVGVLGKPPEQVRRRSVQSALNYLRANQGDLLGSARSDLTALQQWRGLVQHGQVEFDARYRREYLATEQFHRFDEALVRLLELLELPGIGKVLSNALWVVRTPYRLLKGLVSKAMRRPEMPAIPERPMLEGALTGWLDMLRKETARRSEIHPVWAYLETGFQGGLSESARERFEEGLRNFHLSLGDEVDRTARAIYEELEKNPVALNTLRGTKFALDAAAITGALVVGGINVWDVVLVPLAASVTQQLVELLGAQYVDSQREHARLRQQALVGQYISGPLMEWLAQWPSTGGSPYERLHLALKRTPENLKRLDTVLHERLDVGMHS